MDEFDDTPDVTDEDDDIEDTSEVVVDDDDMPPSGSVDDGAKPDPVD